jgi:pantetheine-phosphate adenylyltransferase
MKKRAVFPGSFDPFTKGHEVIVRKALTIFDEVIIGVGVNSAKNYLFPLDKRILHIESLFKEDGRVEIRSFDTLTVHLCQEMNANHIVRGLRDSKDFGYERSIAHMNFSISGIETVFFLTNQEFSAINASIVREIYRNKGDISAFVPHVDLLL